MAVKSRAEFVAHLEENLQWVIGSINESQGMYENYKKELDGNPTNKECNEIVTMLEKVINCKSQVKTLIENALKVSMA